jgi:predicted MPP superfamily phosphohydrolase
MGYIAGAAAAALGGYAVFIERKALTVTRLELEFARLPKSFDGFTILHLSDLHLSHWWELERRIEAAIHGFDGQIDLFVVTGDLAVNSRGARLMREFLGRVNPGGETYAVYGNTEHKGDYGRRRREDLSFDGLRILTNEHLLIERGGDRIVLAGVDDPFTSHDDVRKSLSGAPEDAFKLLLAHAPDAAGDAADSGVDLLLSGHTHGGQVRFPVLGAIYPHLRRHRGLVQGLFEGNRLSKCIKRDAGGMRVYVSNGIGISNLPIRFLCPPEITFITLAASA